MAHPCPPALDPNPSAPQPKPSHWESPPILGLGTRVATSAWHVLSITRISTSKLNTHERPHTYKPRPYLTGPTHLPQPWRSGEKQRKRLLSTRARQPPPRNSAAPETSPPRGQGLGGRGPQMRTKVLHGQPPEPEWCSKGSPGGAPMERRERADPAAPPQGRPGAHTVTTRAAPAPTNKIRAGLIF